jgi:hypothetical protein
MNLREKAIDIQIKKDYILLILSDKDYRKWHYENNETEIFDSNDNPFSTDLKDIFDNYLDEIGIIVVSKSMNEGGIIK